MNIEDLRVRLEDAVARARDQIEENAKCAPKSYGAGYDDGFLRAMTLVLKAINGEDVEDLL